MAASEDVYAKELFKSGKGYPLWQPEATEDDVEVELGDVGYLDKGGFCRLFNACREWDDPLNNKPQHVPDGFVKFPADLSPKKTRGAVDAGPLLSKSVKKLGGKAEVGVHAGKVDFECECAENQGAFVVVGSLAPREEFHQTRRMKLYMKKHIDSWYRYMIEGLGIERNLDDILFVKGWVKTTHWAVAAFVERAKSAKVKVSAGLGPVAEAGVGFLVETTYSSVDHHTGPGGYTFPQASPSIGSGRKRKGKNREQLRESTDTGSRIESRPTQCIFLHYLKLRKRLLLPDKIEAAAEPKDPSSSHDEDDYDFEEAPVARKPYDPVDHVLDYILKYSEATEAIASDTDILELCKNNEDTEYPIPDDISAFLETIHPEIEVNSDGLGMLMMNDAITREVIAESVALAQQNPVDPEASQPEDNSPDHAMAQSEAGDGSPAGSVDENDAPGSDHDDVDMEGSRRAPDADEGEEKKTTDYAHSDSLLQMPEGNLERKGGVFALAYSPAGNKIAAGFEDNTAIIWSGDTRQLLHTLNGHHNAICSLAFSPDGTRLVTGSRDELVIIWDVLTGNKLKVLRGHEGFVNCVAYSPNGRLIASASVDSTVKLWDAETGAEHATTDGHEAMVMSVAFSSDSQRIVSASAEGVAFLWDTIDGQRTSTLYGHEGVIYSTAFSPHNDRLITSSDDGSAKVWSTISGDEYMTLREHQGSVWAAVFSADGRHVLSVGSERTVKICDSYSADLIDTIDGGDDLANAATFSAEGKYIAAGGEDHTISVWNTDTRRRIRQFRGHQDNINRIAFSPDNKRLVSASDDGTVRLWKLPTETAQPTVAATI